jgi:beta-lactamase class A
MSSRIQEMFEQAGCSGQVCVLSLDGAQEVAVDADRSVVTASVFKVSVALEAETQFADGRLDPRERVSLPATARTPGPIGFSLFRDDVEVSLQDLVVAMLTISDNDATDALLDRIGIDAVNASPVRLGLAETVIASDLGTIINSIGRAAGFADWDARRPGRICLGPEVMPERYGLPPIRPSSVSRLMPCRSPKS